MASLFPFSLLLLLLSASAAHRHPKSTLADLDSPLPIQLACNATRYPSACRLTLSRTPPDSTPSQFITAALQSSSSHLSTAQSMVSHILSTSQSSPNRSAASQICLQLLELSSRRTSLALTSSPRSSRAFASASLVYQYDCWSALKYVNTTQSVNSTMAFINDSLLVSTSNALSMISALLNFGSKTSAWSPPKTERDGFWEPNPATDSPDPISVEVPGVEAANVTVCAAGCDFKTVQGAVEAAPSGIGAGEKHVIHVKAGVYDEIVRVAYEKKNLVVVGDGIGKTVITGNLSVGGSGITTYSTATVGVFGDGFMARDLTIQNTAGPGGNQAVAFRSDSDLSLLQNCAFLGNQDTLYAHSLRQLYKSCHIEGNVDFIFGMSAALFQECTILVRPRQSNPQSGETNAVTAHGRTDPAQATGFAFFGCLINGTEDYMRLYYSKPSVHKNFLGRPWKEYSRTVFIDSVLESLISPGGWMPWTGDFALATLYYGEYGNVGRGADLSKRVAWSSKIPAEHVGAYSARNFVQGDEYEYSVASGEGRGM